MSAVTIHNRDEEVTFYRTDDGAVSCAWTLEGLETEIGLTIDKRRELIEILRIEAG